ncbi:MAG: UDP-N-acetylmuramoyl-L-alanyl-D-glutamate--2,6-diaminopimelate ligase [Pyrinomonadaceae bacterium]|nr:UDP-N-acetylmuramoyl-L-alanyl-D-glutamate--2,6-diaminopimelate ligase [Pyrinomonadaceae bacterium]
MADIVNRQPQIKLGEVAQEIGAKLIGNERAEVKDITHDSREVSAGWLFAAIRGAMTDGNLYVNQALERGSIGIISEQIQPPNFPGSWLEVSDARRALALAAAKIHHHPSRELELVGITGTNGKTTTAYLVAEIAEKAETPVALMGTVEKRIGSERLRSSHTTTEASDTQRFLRRAVEAGCHAAVMECSSHAIALHRCDALSFSVAVFTNLTRDHLDYHGTLDEYFAVKRRLFDGSLGERPRTSVINVDDARGRELARDLRQTETQVVRYAVEQEAEVREADVAARGIEFSLQGTSFRLQTRMGERVLRSPLIGRPHVYNILAAIATGMALGYDLDLIARGIETCRGAPGRFELVPHREEFAVVVDYAHTDDALENVLRTARSVARARVITVFGCGGDRDRTKRAPMGQRAAELSDVVILTSDNPRTEDPAVIAADVEIGLSRTRRPYRKILDRREAIHSAIGEAKTGDVVLIAGKGHEDYQIIGTEVLPFSDREVARQALQLRTLQPISEDLPQRH